MYIDYKCQECTCNVLNYKCQECTCSTCNVSACSYRYAVSIFPVMELPPALSVATCITKYNISIYLM